MSVAFPLSPAPSTYTDLTPSQPHGVYYAGGAAPSFTLSKSGATAYTVRDYYGNVVASGSVSGTTLTPATPAGGWLNGWYRLYLTGPVSDTLFGLAYGSTNFVVISSDARFPTVTATTASGGESRDIALKAALGMGTSRLTIADVNNPTTTTDTIAAVTADVTLSSASWTVSAGSPYYDAARPRLLWANFPNGTATAANVTSVVSQLYALGITRFEGPSNEPSPNAALVPAMQNFYNAVKAANSNAIVLGPCPVNLNSTSGGGLEQFLAAGGGNYIDEWAVHAYNSQINGDISAARTAWAAFKALLAKYGQQNKPIWQTESTHSFTSVYGVHHPRRARIPILQTLLCEQQGIPRERNNYWYDWSHGFWAYPSWWINSDGSVNPVAPLYRTLAAETFGKTHTTALSFGSMGDRIFLGSVYTGSSGSTVVLVAQSCLPGATITLAITGATGTLTTVDAFGNTGSVTVTNGQVVIAVGEVPTYLRLPAGATATVARVSDWPANQSGVASSALNPAVTAVGNLDTPAYVNDGLWNGTTGTQSVPDTVTLRWPTATRVDRVLIWCGCFQYMSTLVDFDVQTSNDGTTWTTRATVTKTAPSSFLHGSSSTGVGCQYETYWDEQWIFDVKLTVPVTAKMVRLNVRDASNGGEPDTNAMSAGGQGDSLRKIHLQEVAVLCDDNAVPHYATV